MGKSRSLALAGAAASALMFLPVLVAGAVDTRQWAIAYWVALSLAWIAAANALARGGR